MRTIAIIQARMTSTRLPGKVLLDLAGKPILVWQIQRLKRASRIDHIVVATTVNPSDDEIVAVTEAQGVKCFRGDEHDVLSRFVGAAREFGADAIVRLTADCPMTDPAIVDEVVQALTDRRQQIDYCSNVIQRTYPRGLDVEALFVDVLLRIQRLAGSNADREHVTLPPRDHRAHLFSRYSVVDVSDNSDLRLTVDRLEDLKFLRVIASSIGTDLKTLSCHEIVSYLRQHPDLASIDSEHTTWDPTRH